MFILMVNIKNSPTASEIMGPISKGMVVARRKCIAVSAMIFTLFK